MKHNRTMNQLNGYAAAAIVMLLTNLVTIAEAGNANFTAEQCGENSGAKGKMEVGDSMEINGNADLSTCINGKHKSTVFSSELKKGRCYLYGEYNISVEAKGPKGWGNGSFYLRFYDQTNDYYDLSVWKSSKDKHCVGMKSDNPTVRAIYWNNKIFKPYPFCLLCEPRVGIILKGLDKNIISCKEISTQFVTACENKVDKKTDKIATALICKSAGHQIKQDCKTQGFENFKARIENRVSRHICQKIKLCPNDK
jgi:hypothetical protein